jgi:membrane protease YdiL (CAAX protease family)
MTVSLRRRVALELATLAVLTSMFLRLVPKRPMWIDAGLGLFAVALVAATARRTREQIWAPLAMERRGGPRHCWRDMLIGTAAVALLFAIIGRWTGRAGPLFTANVLAALGPFMVWATVQQLLFQFYLLGRLRALSPSSPPLALAAINGLLFGAVHLPDVEVTVLTSVGGAVWSWYYLRDQCLGPIAVSHAVLGTTYYYWIRSDDLLARWLSAARW